MTHLCIKTIFATNLLLLSGLSACTSYKTSSKTIIVTDMLGNSVKINKNLKKVACVSRTTYDLLIAFGLGDYIDGAYKYIYDNPWVEYIYPNAKNQYRYNYEENFETFLSRGVDLVFAPEKYICDYLKQHGINALCICLYGNSSFDNYVYFFADLISQIWDDWQVQSKVNYWKNTLANTISDISTVLNENHLISDKKLYYVRGDKNKGIEYTDNGSSFTEYAFRQLGFKFVGSDFDTNTPSVEAICHANPDVFVIGGIWQNKLVNLLKTTDPYFLLPSVKNNKIFTIPVGFTMFEQISIMTPIFFCDMANKLYSDYFNYDIPTMVSSTIEHFFNKQLTEKEISYMLLAKDYQGIDLA